MIFSEGGPDTIVEIDESLFARHKYHTGRLRESTQIWVLGFVQRGTGDCRFEVVGRDRSAATLLPLIRKHVKPGGTLYSDMWRAYLNVHIDGYLHYTVNHSLEFVNSDLLRLGVRCHTQTIESTWCAAKKHFHSMNGSWKKNIQEYLDLYSMTKYNTRMNISSKNAALSYKHYEENQTQSTNQQQEEQTPLNGDNQQIVLGQSVLDIQHDSIIVISSSGSSHDKLDSSLSVLFTHHRSENNQKQHIQQCIYKKKWGRKVLIIATIAQKSTQHSLV
ncbi:Conserved_hypothetical protein [Hexamita inflata]|uniref:ISXO2-like transposase domain-containing protein n=1 Tax=Hexamita inflata TaxID=28002 RepID=A0AA86QXT7_9EUKA|nr:Conserved hypothetical protein [Hexamita inflata]